MTRKHDHKHHRCPRSRGGDSSKGNISMVDRDKHEAWHRLFRNHDPQQIAVIINNVWLDPDYEFVVVRKIP